MEWRLPPQQQDHAQAPAKPWTAPDLPAIVGALLIVLSLVATFVLKGRIGAMAAAAGSLIAAGALYYSVMVQGRAAVAAYFGAVGPGPGTGGGPSAADIAEMIRYEVQLGFWLVLAALAAAIVLNVLAMRASAAPATPAAAPAPPPPPPAEPPPEPPAG